MANWSTSISNAFKQTVKDQIWPVFTAGAAVAGAVDGYKAGVETHHKNKVNAYKAAIGVGASQAKKSVIKAALSTATKATGVGAAISFGTNFIYRLGQERGAW